MLDAAKAVHVPMHFAALIRQQYEAAFAAGLAEQDFFVLVDQHEQLVGSLPASEPA